ncbi:MAG TPA: hypothetical protein VK966_00315, partial [Longimicrobiales bacterium]|nr:hypothetical protein [Longimicrobiales bacterium]
LEHPGAWSPEFRGRPAGVGGGGPAVAPGSYQVRVTAGSWSQTRPLAVRMDPRLPSIGIDESDLREQERLALDVRDLLSEARLLRREVAGMVEDLDPDQEPGQAGSEREARLREIHAALTTEQGIAYPQPMLVDQIQYLYGMVARTPQNPGGDAYTRYQELRAELDALSAELETVGRE